MGEKLTFMKKLENRDKFCGTDLIRGIKGGQKFRAGVVRKGLKDDEEGGWA